jgi:integrase
LAPAEVDALLGALRTHRDRAMVLAMLLGGLRRCEVLGLRMQDVQAGERRLFIAEGKGGHQRVVPVSGRSFTALAGYFGRFLPRTGCLLCREWQDASQRQDADGLPRGERRPLGHRARMLPRQPFHGLVRGTRLSGSMPSGPRPERECPSVCHDGSMGRPSGGKPAARWRRRRRILVIRRPVAAPSR